jgi:membrane-associated phospholipid phosphatase
MRRTEVDVLLAVQRATSPAARRVARGLSLAGEHAAAWIVLGGLGAAVDRDRRAAWGRATAVVVGAHGVSVVVKRLARRVRPVHPELLPGVAVPSRWSFPSSHATSTTAAALAYGGLLGSRAPLLAVPVMAWSRLALGVHYPTDVAAGSALGAAVVVGARRLQR